MFENAFPRELEQDVLFVESRILVDGDIKVYAENTIWKLPSKVSVSIPDRVIFPDSLIPEEEGFSPEQALIYHCIFSRSLDGHVREKHVREMLESSETWIAPYILRICENYVVQILQLVFDKLKNSDCTIYIECAQRNLWSFVQGHQRMRSYWDVYYRRVCPRYENFVGKHLYDECFGYTKSMEKLARREHLKSQENGISEKP